MIGFTGYHYLELYMNSNLEFVYNDSEENKDVLLNCGELSKVIIEFD